MWTRVWGVTKGKKKDEETQPYAITREGCLLREGPVGPGRQDMPGIEAVRARPMSKAATISFHSDILLHFFVLTPACIHHISKRFIINLHILAYPGRNHPALEGHPDRTTEGHHREGHREERPRRPSWKRAVRQERSAH